MALEGIREENSFIISFSKWATPKGKLENVHLLWLLSLHSFKITITITQ